MLDFIVSKLPIFISVSFLLISCAAQSNFATSAEEFLKEAESLSQESRWTAAKEFAGKLVEANELDNFLLFAPEFVEKNPDDNFCAYWLYSAAICRLERGENKAAEYYFERALSTKTDLLVDGQSIHCLCLQNLAKISNDAKTKIFCLKHLLSDFSQYCDLTELYARLAFECESAGEWDEALEMSALYVAQPNAASAQIAGLPNAFQHATSLLNLQRVRSSQIFDDLPSARDAIAKLLAAKNGSALDKAKSKTNFFATTWRQMDDAANAQVTITLAQIVQNSTKLTCGEDFEKNDDAQTAFLKTEGWNSDYRTWYFAFRKINFPPKPNLHGKWEWCGIYYGEKT